MSLIKLAFNKEAALGLYEALQLGRSALKTTADAIETKALPKAKSFLQGLASKEVVSNVVQPKRALRDAAGKLIQNYSGVK